MLFKKIVPVSMVLVCSSIYAFDYNQYDIYQADSLPEITSYDGFIVYLKDPKAMSASNSNSAELMLENAIDGIVVPARTGTDGLVVKSATDLGIFNMTENAMKYLANENEKIFSTLKNHPNIALVEPNFIVKPTMKPNDPKYPYMWSINGNVNGLTLEPVWDNYKGYGVRVAVIDTGITKHPDLDYNIDGGYDFISNATAARDRNGRDTNPKDEGDWHWTDECRSGVPRKFIASSWHGTHVAGTIAMAGNNGVGGIGIAHLATVVPIRALGKCGGTTQDISDAMIWAAGGNWSGSGLPNNQYPAKILNLSLGSPRKCTATEQRSIDYVTSWGATVVVAAGNHNIDVSNFAPANCDKVIAVAALDELGNRASYSNYGSKIDIAAPGSSIYSTHNSGTRAPLNSNYDYKNGTSMAAPHISGAIALLKERRPDLTSAQIEAKLKSTAKPIPGQCSGGCGAGMVDLVKLLGIYVPPPSTKLLNGVPVAIENLKQSETKLFNFDILEPLADLTVTLSGGTGDMDLSVRRLGSKINCTSKNSDNNERCTIKNAFRGAYEISINGYRYSEGASIIASWKTPNLLENGLWNNVGNLSKNQRKTFNVIVPSGVTTLTVETTGGTGDLDLVITSLSEEVVCNSANANNEEKCVVDSPLGGNHIVTVFGYSDSYNSRIRATW